MQTIFEDYGTAIVYMLMGMMILTGLGKVLELFSAF